MQHGMTTFLIPKSSGLNLGTNWSAKNAFFVEVEIKEEAPDSKINLKVAKTFQKIWLNSMRHQHFDSVQWVSKFIFAIDFSNAFQNFLPQPCCSRYIEKRNTGRLKVQNLKLYYWEHTNGCTSVSILNLGEAMARKSNQWGTCAAKLWKMLVVSILLDMFSASLKFSSVLLIKISIFQMIRCVLVKKIWAIEVLQQFKAFMQLMEKCIRSLAVCINCFPFRFLFAQHCLLLFI